MSDGLCVLGPWFGSAEGHPACGHCYVIKTWVLMAVMITDILLTLLITASVFCLMTKLKRRRDPDTGKRTATSRATTSGSEVTESPYQALQGVQSDVYSELETFSK